MFFVVCFFIAWFMWIIFADKKRWRELFLVSFFASHLACFTDTLTHFYPLWSYHNPKSFLTYTLDDFGVYMVIPYLFIQWLPSQRTPLKMIGYWFIWTGVSIFIEWVFLTTDHMKHLSWWSIYHSYMADWVLFWLFYQFHKIFRLELLFKRA
ncbi:MAG TPA: hypothetical protein DEF36_15080 [Desulfotomaculum sp.]|nr:hypothetical protein [Desulfotomaculum sp.]